MHLIQILLPVRDNDGRKFKKALYADIRQQLVKRFGGLTTYSRSPARGLWKDQGATKADDIVVLEVMTRAVDRAWWAKYRKQLERAFRQDEIVMRSQTIDLL